MNELQQEQVRELIQQFRDGALGRRDFLRQVVALGVGSAVSYSLLEQTELKAQEFGTPSTMAIGEEDLPVVEDQLDYGHPEPQATTLMVGEEDVHQPPNVITLRVGEGEPPHGPQPTTKMVGEEDIQQPPQVTTQAIGEEDQGGLPTTAMAGEEDNYISPPQPSTRMVGEEDNAAPPPMSTMAVGEEENALPVCPPQRPWRPWNGWRRW